MDIGFDIEKNPHWLGEDREDYGRDKSSKQERLPS